MEDVTKAFKVLFSKHKVTYSQSANHFLYIIVQKVGTFHISVKVEKPVFETCRVTYDLLNGTSGILIDNTESKDLKITSKNNSALFMNNLIYTPKKGLKIEKLP